MTIHGQFSMYSDDTLSLEAWRFLESKIIELCLEYEMKLNDMNMNDFMNDINMEYDARKSGGSKARQGVMKAKKKYQKENMKNTNERLSRKEVNYAKDNARKGAFKPRCRTEYPPPKMYRDKKKRKKQRNPGSILQTLLRQQVLQVLGSEK